MKQRLGVILIIVLGWLLLNSATTQAQPQVSRESPPIELTKNWQYRWGESPADEKGVPLWTYQELNSPEWKPAPSQYNLPGHEGKKILWLRASLPAGTWKLPTIYLPRVFLNLEVYLESKLIYSFGELESAYANRFSAFVPHRISLPEDFQGKNLFFRLYSDWSRINGIEGTVLMGSNETLLLHIIRRNAGHFIVGAFCVFIGLFSLAIYLDRSVRRAYAALSFGLFSTFIGIVFIAVISPIVLLVPAPAFWYYALFISFLLFPPALIAFVDQVIGPGYKYFVRRLWQLHLVIAIIAIVLEVLNIIPLAAWQSYLRLLWIIDCLAIMVVSLHAAIQGRIEARIFTAGIGFFSIFALHDILRETGVNLMPVGTFIFIHLLVYILFRRFTENSRRLRIYSKELEENSKKLEAAKRELEEYSQSLEYKVEERTREVREKQTQLVQSSKMASLGSLVAGVAHEINTPVGAISSMHNTLMRAVERLKIELERALQEARKEHKDIKASLKVVDDANKVIQSGTERVIDIVKRLRSFARLDEAELKDADINEGLEDTLTIIHHEIKHHIKIIRNYGKIPLISCFPGRLNQVFLNLLINAKQAIKDKGEITISTNTKNNKVYIEIKDNGEGIPKENLDKIFDPGFTTKGVGVGTGLGLSICYQIVQDHMGEILAESEVGKGSTFTVILPTDLDKKLNQD
jgi:signal transduction histidine kinase